MKVLIVEDDATSRHLLMRLVEKWGYEVLNCGTGQEALTIFEQNDGPLLALVDWMMPEMDGLALCQKIRALPQGSQAYLILVTSRSDKNDVARGLREGANDYVVKPFDAEELEARVGVGRRVVELQEQLIAAERENTLKQTAGAAAHEIFQPLMVVMGNAQLLLQAKESDELSRQQLEGIEKAAYRIRRIVDTMSDSRRYVTRPYINRVEIADFEASATPLSATAETHKILRQNRLLQALSRAQSQRILDVDPRELFGELLENLLELTESEYGFIGEVFRKPDGDPYLKTHAITNIAWDEDTRRFYEENAPGGLEFYNLNTLFGHVLVSEELVISNDPQNDPRGGGIPEGHPPLNAFLGVPFLGGEGIIGMVGIANRPGGYDLDLATELRPFLLTCSTIIQSYRAESARKEAESAVRESEILNRAIVNTSVEAIVTIDAAGKICAFNPAAERMFGYGAEEILGENVSRLMSEPYQSDHDAYMRHHIESDEVQIISEGREVQGLRKDGSIFSLEVSVGKMDIEDAAPSFVAVFRDISEWKEHERQLIAARETADAANRAKSDFLSIMGHEIRTPLNGILGVVQLLEDDNLEQAQRDDLNIIRQSGESLLSVINDILDFSKAESGGMDIDRHSFELERTIQLVHGLFRQQAQDRGLAYHLQLCDDLPEWVIADSNRIKQILMNLLSNALKFTDNGSVTLAVAIEENELVFCVKDTGTGISDTSSIWLPFRQEDASITRLRGGTGLGLAICRKLAELMEGTIEVESSPSEGSEFTVRLPFEIGQPDLGVESKVDDHISPLSILAVEDNRVNQIVVSRILEKLGHRVTVVDEGEQAVKLCQNNAYDLVLMDLHLPGLSGLQATKQIRNLDILQPVIVALTADATADRRASCVAAGMNDFLTKPIRAEELIEIIRRIANGQSGTS